MYPLGRSIKIEKGQYNTMRAEELEIQYILNPIDCGDGSETHTVREWLAEFDLPIRDESFIQWQQTIAVVGTKIHEMEPVYPDNCMEDVWSFVFFALYLNYDMAKAYDEQIAENSRRLIEALNKLPMPKEVKNNE